MTPLVIIVSVLLLSLQTCPVVEASLPAHTQPHSCIIIPTLLQKLSAPSLAREYESLFVFMCTCDADQINSKSVKNRLDRFYRQLDVLPSVSGKCTKSTLLAIVKTSFKLAIRTNQKFVSQTGKPWELVNGQLMVTNGAAVRPIFHLFMRELMSHFTALMELYINRFMLTLETWTRSFFLTEYNTRIEHMFDLLAIIHDHLCVGFEYESLKVFYEKFIRKLHIISFECKMALRHGVLSSSLNAKKHGKMSSLTPHRQLAVPIDNTGNEWTEELARRLQGRVAATISDIPITLLSRSTHMSAHDMIMVVNEDRIRSRQQTPIIANKWPDFTVNVYTINSTVAYFTNYSHVNISFLFDRLVATFLGTVKNTIMASAILHCLSRLSLSFEDYLFELMAESDERHHLRLKCDGRFMDGTRNRLLHDMHGVMHNCNNELGVKGRLFSGSLVAISNTHLVSTMTRAVFKCTMVIDDNENDNDDNQEHRQENAGNPVSIHDYFNRQYRLALASKRHCPQVVSCVVKRQAVVERREARRWSIDSGDTCLLVVNNL